MPELEMTDLRRRGIVLSIVAKTKGADQLHSYCEADLRLVFAYARIGFSHNLAQAHKESALTVFNVS